MEHLAAISRVVQRHLKVVLRYQEAIFWISGGHLGGIWKPIWRNMQVSGGFQRAPEGFLGLS